VTDEESTMVRLRGKLLNGDPHLFDQVDGSIAVQESPGIPEWPGRFWLPDSSPVRSGGRFCQIPDDGPSGEPVVEGSGRGAAEGSVAVFLDDSRLE
jgi:hypothetical protein